MRSVIFFSFVCMLTSFANCDADAQINANKEMLGTAFVGPVAGFGNSWITYLPGSATFKPSGYVGIGIIQSLAGRWGWGGQAVVSAEGYQINYSNSLQTVTPIYLRVPLRAYLFLGDRYNIVRPEIYIGPSFALKLGEHSTTSAYYRETYLVGSSDNFETFDAGINGGVGVNARLSKKARLNVDIGFYSGFTNAVKNMPDNFEANQNIELSAGLLFAMR